MSPFPWISAGVAVASLARKCPKCKKVQLVSARAKHRSVPCAKCGTPMPPKQPDRSRGPRR
jgi:uncharacterized protein (DUF983 family)